MMSNLYYAVIDNDGNLVSRHIAGIGEVPAGARQITAQEHAALALRNKNAITLSVAGDGSLVITDKPDGGRTLAEAKAQRLRALLTWVDQRQAQELASFPAMEIASFPDQQIEATALLDVENSTLVADAVTLEDGSTIAVYSSVTLNTGVSSPFIDKLLTFRNATNIAEGLQSITKEELVRRIVNSAIVFKAKAAIILGIKQAKQDAISAATTVSAVDAITWS